MDLTYPTAILFHKEGCPSKNLYSMTKVIIVYYNGVCICSGSEFHRFVILMFYYGWFGGSKAAPKPPIQILFP